jgi:polar amino acid transport system substrate-binding protein
MILQSLYICVFLFLSIPVYAQAQHDCEWNNSSDDKIIVGIADYPPWRFMDSNQAKGIDVEFLQELARSLKVTIEFTPCIWTDCLALMKTGKIELLSNVFRFPEREVYMDFIEPEYIAGSIRSFYKKTKNRNQIERFEHLSGLTVGVQRDVMHFERFTAASTISKVSFESNEEVLQALLNEEVDTILGQRNVFDYLVNSDPEKYASISRQRFEVFLNQPGYFAVSKCAKKPQFWAKFKLAFSTLGNHEFIKKRLSEFETKHSATNIR